MVNGKEAQAREKGENQRIEVQQRREREQELGGRRRKKVQDRTVRRSNTCGADAAKCERGRERKRRERIEKERGGR
jgi:hypothetical protein